MEWVETTGKSVDEAKSQALDQLGVAEDDAEIVVLDEPRPGLFGRVRGEARVRARVRPTTPRPKLDRRDRKKKDGTAGAAGSPDRGTESSMTAGSAGAAGDDQDGDEAVAESGRSTGTRARGRRGGTGRSRAAVPAGDGSSGSSSSSDGDSEGDGFAAAFSDDRSAVTAGAADNTSARANTRSGGGRSKPRAEAGGGQASPRRTRSNTDTPVDGTGDKEDMVDAAQVGEEARMFVQGVVDAFDLIGTASVVQDGDDLEVAVEGADLGLLVGPRGSTLQALQELTRVAAQRRLGDHDTRLRVDVGGYRVRRREALSKFADQVAVQVVAEGVAKRLEPMSSADRKVIHDVLSEFEGVVTRSEGDDPRRCVVIEPSAD